MLLLYTRNSISCVLGSCYDIQTRGELQTTYRPLCRPIQSWNQGLLPGKEKGSAKRRNRQWQGKCLTNENFRRVPKVKQQLWGWCTQPASVFTSNVPCTFLFSLKPRCVFDSFPIVSFHPKLFLPVQASLPLGYFPGLVCNERHLISKESLVWILKWVFEADCCSVEGNPAQALGLWGVEMGNTGYAGTRSRWE